MADATEGFVWRLGVAEECEPAGDGVAFGCGMEAGVKAGIDSADDPPEDVPESDLSGAGAAAFDALGDGFETWPPRSAIFMTREVGPGNVAAAAPAPTRTMVPPTNIAATSLGLRLIPTSAPEDVRPDRLAAVRINSSRVLAMSGAALPGVRVVTLQFVALAVAVFFISRLHALFT